MMIYGWLAIGIGAAWFLFACVKNSNVSSYRRGRNGWPIGD